MTDDLQSKLRAALAAERTEERNVALACQRIEAAKEAVHRSQEARQRAVELAAAGQSVDALKLSQNLQASQGAVELLTEVSAVIERRLSAARVVTDEVLSCFAQKRIAAEIQSYEKAKSEFLTASRVRDAAYHRQHSAIQLTNATGRVLRDAFRAEIAAAAAP